MVSGSKTTLCDYSVLFSLVIYREKTARSDFEQEPSRSSGVWADMATTISVMRLHSIFPPFFPLFPLQPLLPPIIPLTPPLKQINCLRPHAKMVRQLRQPKMTTRCFAKVLSPYNPLSPKAIPLASIADRKRELT